MTGTTIDPEQQPAVYAFESILEASDNKLWGCHFQVPRLIADALSIEGEAKRVVCRLQDKVEYQCAMLPKGDGALVITVNKSLQTKLGIKPGSKVQVRLHRDDSAYGLPVPEELAELLAQDAEGHRVLHALTPGKIRTLLYLVAQPKSSELRLFRAMVVVDHLKEYKGKIDYKILNAALKKKDADI